jgi:hypothetical protein
VACGHPSCPGLAAQAIECPRNRVNSTAIIVFVLACMLALRGREADAGAMERGGWGGF